MVDCHPLKTALIADDDRLFAGLLEHYLRHSSTLTLQKTVFSGEELLETWSRQPCDCLFLSIRLPGISLQMLREFLADQKNLKVVAMGKDFQSDILATYVSLGIQSFLSKADPPQTVLTCLHHLANGKNFCQLPVARPTRQMRYLLHPQVQELSARELEVLNGICQGKTNKELAAQLSLGVRTVETHRSRLNQKLQVRSTAELVLFAVKTGIVEV